MVSEIFGGFLLILIAALIGYAFGEAALLVILVLAGIGLILMVRGFNKWVNAKRMEEDGMKLLDDMQQPQAQGIIDKLRKKPQRPSIVHEWIHGHDHH